ncbi:MAG TPA: DUF1707 domain-containing protein [Solirubrobacteraceae bacterium]
MTKRGSFRASDADRDGVVDRLRKAATEGRIAAEELEQRVSAALKARTYDELYATVSDLPDGSRNRRAPARRSTAGWALAVVRENPVLLVVAIPVLAVTAAMLLAATIVWTVLVVVVLMLGGRPRMARGPWHYYRRQSWGSPRRGPGGHWV